MFKTTGITVEGDKLDCKCMYLNVLGGTVRIKEGKVSGVIDGECPICAMKFRFDAETGERKTIQ